MEVQSHRTRKRGMVEEEGGGSRDQSSRGQKVRHPKGVDRAFGVFQGRSDQAFDRVVLVSAAFRRDDLRSKTAVRDHHLAAVAGVFMQDDRLRPRRASCQSEGKKEKEEGEGLRPPHHRDPV